MKHHSLLTYMYSSKLPLKLGSVPPDAALRALVLLYALGLRRSDLHTFPMVPPLTYITTNPKLVGIVITAAAPAKCFTVLVFLLLLITIIHRKLWVAFDLPVTGSLGASSGFTSAVCCWLVVLNWFPVGHDFENSRKFVDQTKQTFPFIAVKTSSEIEGHRKQP